MKRLAFGAALLAAASLSALGAQAEEVTLSIWSEHGEGQMDYELVREFDEKNPDITVEYRQIAFDDIVADTLRAFATGNTPDIIAIDNPDHAAFSSRGAFLDLTPYIEKSDIVDPDTFFDGPRSSLTWDGGIYGVPRASNTIALYYNRDMFKAAGLDPDNPPKTWDELYEAAKTLNDPDNNVYGLAFSAKASEEGTFQFLPWVQMTGGDFDTINVPGAVKALEFWDKLLKEGLASPDTLTRGQWDSTGTFNAGNAAMAISGPWEIRRMSKDAAFDWDVALLPVPEEGAPRASALGDFNFAVFANTEHPDEAFALLEYITAQADRQWAEFSRMPARSDVAIKETGNPRVDRAVKVFQEQLSYARVRGPHPEWPRISRAIHGAVQQALTGGKSAQEALDDAHKQISALLGQ